MRAFELAGHFLEAEHARPRARQIVRRRAPELVLGFRALPERLGALARCLFAVDGRTSAIARGLHSIGSGPCPVALGPYDDVVRAS